MTQQMHLGVLVSEAENSRPFAPAKPRGESLHRKITPFKAFLTVQTSDGIVNCISARCADDMSVVDYLTHHEELYRERRKSIRHQGWETGYENAKTDLSRIIRNGRCPTSGVALELGCGAGNMTIWLAEQGFRAHGID